VQQTDAVKLSISDLCKVIPFVKMLECSRRSSNSCTSALSKRHVRNEQPCRYLFELLFPIQPKPFGLRWKMVLWDHVVLRSVSTTGFTTRSRRFIEKRASRTHPAVLKLETRHAIRKPSTSTIPLLLSRCWLVNWKGIRPVLQRFPKCSLLETSGTQIDVLWPWKSGLVKRNTKSSGSGGVLQHSSKVPLIDF